MSEREIAERYRLLREVGRGGMATVFLAVDEKHQREVALKALRPDLAAAVGSERFLREIEITARLNHPHILPLLDSGTEDGFFYYVMPYVSGGSLRRLLATDTIPLAAVTRIVREVAAALDHAHAQGVIHRDIKPENILFNEGLAVVSDFGIAKAMSGVASRMTGTGLSVGTLGYMSPEQALATAELDARSDVYSLGCVVYEMLVGQTPASWPGAEDVELGRFTELPDEHRTRLDGYPGRVEQVLVRALALRLQHRYESTGELAAALTTASERTARFSDEEVRQLLRRAAEIEAETPTPSLDLTMGHVEQIAAQVGIRPDHVREAAKELERPVPSAAVPALERPVPSGPVPALDRSWTRLREEWNRLVAKETLDGSVPDEALPAMVAEIQRHLGIAGHASIVVGTLTWTPAVQSDDTRKIVIQVTTGEHRTDIRIQEDLGLWGVRKLALPVGGLFGAAFGGAMGQACAVGDPGQGLLILALAGAGVLTAVRSVVAIDATDRGPELEGLAGKLAEIGRAALEMPSGREVGDQAGPA